MSATLYSSLPQLPLYDCLLQLTVDRKLDKLDDVSLKLQYSPSKLRAEGFFRRLERSLEWYFDLERCISGLL
jgi:hypothetical protein